MLLLSIGSQRKACLSGVFSLVSPDSRTRVPKLVNPLLHDVVTDEDRDWTVFRAVRIRFSIGFV